MKVLLVANYGPDGQTSMQAFQNVLARELPAQNCEIRVIAPSPVVLRVPSTSRLWKWLGYVDKFILFLPTLRYHARWADVVHIVDHSNGMYVPRVPGRPTVITCHDVIAYQASIGMVPGWQVGKSGQLFQKLIFGGLAQADAIACVSEHTRRDLRALALADAAKVRLVPMGLNADFAPVAPDEVLRLTAPLGIAPRTRYFLHVGSDLPRKNRMAVLEAFLALQTRAADAGHSTVADRLVFVGPELSAPMAARAVDSGFGDRVQVIRDASHEALRALYAGAVALIFPSLQEGFGWPVIEAQACGCPVFASDLTPMNEVGGDAAVYIDPHDPQQIAATIEAATPRLAEMRTRGLDNARLYAPHQMAEGYAALYREVITARTGAHA